MLTPILVPTVCFVTSLVGARGGSASNLFIPLVCFCCHAQKFVCCSTVPSEVRLVPSLCSPEDLGLIRPPLLCLGVGAESCVYVYIAGPALLFCLSA